MNKIMVVATHPDDETLGCGGTLLKHKAMGDSTHWLIITEPKNDDGFNNEWIKMRNEEVKLIAKSYDFDTFDELRFPTMRLDQVPIKNLIDKISICIKKIEPKVIYLPFKNDVHSDHRIAYEAAFSCTKAFRYPFIKRVLMMETISETEFATAIQNNFFVPNVFNDISDYLEKKIEIMNLYHSETEKHPFPRNDLNIRALATYRGASSGCRYSEAFMLIKEIL